MDFATIIGLIGGITIILLAILSGSDLGVFINIPSIMIVVISSENDEDVKTEILYAGAEDYILKPFSSATMLSRLNNYKKLIASRNSIGYQTRAVNVFTHNIYSYQMRFFLSTEDWSCSFQDLQVTADFYPTKWLGLSIGYQSFNIQGTFPEEKFTAHLKYSIQGPAFGLKFTF